MKDPAWLETEATVVSCRYQFARLSVLAFGIPTGNKFRIAFDYHAHGQRFSDEFQSPVAIPQNQRIPITYNPLHPEQNNLSRNQASAPGKVSLITIGITGSIILSLAWLILLRSCH